MHRRDFIKHGAAALAVAGVPAYAQQLAASALNTLPAYEWPVVREGWLRAYQQAAGHQPKRIAAHKVEPVTTSPSNPA